jgi:hypothetical protein
MRAAALVRAVQQGAQLRTVPRIYQLLPAAFAGVLLLQAVPEGPLARGAQGGVLQGMTRARARLPAARMAARVRATTRPDTCQFTISCWGAGPTHPNSDSLAAAMSCSCLPVNEMQTGSAQTLDFRRSFACDR